MEHRFFIGIAPFRFRYDVGNIWRRRVFGLGHAANRSNITPYVAESGFHIAPKEHGLMRPSPAMVPILVPGGIELSIGPSSM